MSELLESLVPEVHDCLTSSLSLGDFLSFRTANCAWQDRIQKADAAWKSCYLVRFGECADPPSWIEAFKHATKQQQNSMSTWRDNVDLHAQDTFVFASYVRSWASDDSLLVAGLYNGMLQPLDWRSGSVGRPFKGRHGDEVTCIDVSSEYILSGSGDPGYYRRAPTDASVKLWRRSDGECLGSLTPHQDSVRSVLLLPQSDGFGSYAVTAGLDGSVKLLSLTPFREVDNGVMLSGPCRSLRIVAPKWRALSGLEFRVFASSGDSVTELAVRASPSTGTSLEVVGSVRVTAILNDQISGIGYHVRPSIWEEIPFGAEYPRCLLDTDGIVVAGGTVNGKLWALNGKRPRKCGHVIFNSSEAGPTNEVVSVEFLDRWRFIAMSRLGAMCLADWGEAGEAIEVKWRVSGFRMYVSTIRLREPLLLVSDGFDNAIRTIRAGRLQAP